MRIVADHTSEYVVRMDCESCQLTTTVSSFSPFLSHFASIFAATHATCDTDGKPDLDAMVSEIIDLTQEQPTHVAWVDARVQEAQRIAIEKRAKREKQRV